MACIVFGQLAILYLDFSCKASLSIVLRMACIVFGQLAILYLDFSCKASLSIVRIFSSSIVSNPPVAALPA